MAMNDDEIFVHLDRLVLYESVQMDKDLIIVMAANTEVDGAWQRLELARSTQELKKGFFLHPPKYGLGQARRSHAKP